MSHNWTDEYDKPRSKPPKEVSDKMQLSMYQLKGYINDLAKKNARKYVLKSYPDHSTLLYGDPEHILEKMLPIFETSDIPEHVTASKNWRDQIDAQFNISKIKSLLNSKIRKDGRQRIKPNSSADNI